MFRVLGTIDQLLTVQSWIKFGKRNLAVSFYDYQKACDMVKHDWMMSFHMDVS